MIAAHEQNGTWADGEIGRSTLRHASSQS